MSLKVIRDKSQRVWVVGQCLVAHLLCFKAVRKKKTFCEVDAHYIVAHLLSFKMIRNRFQHEQQGSTDPLHDTPGYIFKQVSHLYLNLCGWVRIKIYPEVVISYQIVLK